MTKLAVTRPFLGIGIIRDDNTDMRRLLALATAICIFIWIHRFTFLVLAENINKLFLWIEAGWQAYISLFEVLFWFVELKYLPG